jgi:hypothetical protein
MPHALLGGVKMSSITPEQKEELKLLVAESVKQTLIQLGISSDDPLEVQRDMQHLREWRKSMESIKSKGLLTAVAIAVTGILAALWVGIKDIIVN